jgi:hypothetical protein
VDARSKTKLVPPESAQEAERRRIGRVVHDDRGNASVSWQDAPSDYKRPVLELLPEEGAKPSAVEGCNPYAQRGLGARDPGPARAGGERRRPTDLRKLSEHIKLMRELQTRKSDEDDEA